MKLTMTLILAAMLAMLAMTIHVDAHPHGKQCHAHGTYTTHCHR